MGVSLNNVINVGTVDPAQARDIGMSSAGVPLIYVNGAVKPISYVIGSSGTVTLANGASTTISHGDLGTVPPVVSGVSIGSSTPTQTILLHFNGSDGSTTITDSGSNAGSHTWSVSGNTQIDTAQAKFGSSSLLFDGNGDSLRLAASADMEFTGEFTISFWAWFNVINGIHVLFAPSDTSNNFQLAVYSDGRIDFYTGSTQVCTSSAGAVTTGAFRHIAVTRNSSNVCKIWVDGVEVASGTRSGTLGRSNSQINIGMYADGSYPFNGWKDEWAVNTTCLYTGSFTPPSSAWADSEEVKTHLRLGTDFTATTNTSGTTITNSSGSSYQAQYVLRS